MPGPKFRDTYYESLRWPSVVKAVTGTVTAATALDVWTPASGKKFQLLGGKLSCTVGVVTASDASAGDLLVLYDSVVTACIHVLGVHTDAAIVAGSIFGGTWVSDTAFDHTGAEVGGGDIAMNQVFEIPGGYTASAADNKLRANNIGGDDLAAENINTGKINIIGTVWGHEV